MKIQQIFLIYIFLLLSVLNSITCNLCINWVSIEGYWKLVYTNNVNTTFTLESTVETSQKDADINQKGSILDNLIETAKQGGISFILKKLNSTISASEIAPTILPFDQVQMQGITATQKTTISLNWQNNQQELMSIYQWTIRGEYTNSGSSIQNIQAMGTASLVLPQGVYPKCSVESCSDKTCQKCKVPDFVQRDCKLAYMAGQNQTQITQRKAQLEYDYYCQNSQLIKDCSKSIGQRTGCDCIQIQEGECPQKYPYFIDKQVLNFTNKIIYCDSKPFPSQNNTCYLNQECQGYGSPYSTIEYSKQCLYDYIKCPDQVNQKVACSEVYSKKAYAINIKQQYQICCQSNIFIGSQCTVSSFKSVLKITYINFFIITLSFFLGLI